MNGSLPLPSRSGNKPRPTVRERRVGLFLLGLLVAIAAAILWFQSHFDPSQWRLQPDTDGVEIQKPLLPQSAGKYPTDEHPGHPMDAVTGFIPLTATENYSSDTLSDKINGKAEFYLSAGFKSLQTRRFVSTIDATIWMERYVYDMGQYRSAFAVFAAQRRSNSQPLSLTRDAYASANGLFFVHGPFYVEIIATQVSETVRRGGLELARAFIRNQTVADQSLETSVLFPIAERVADSLSLIAADAFGIDGFDWVHTALYRRNGAEALAFLSKRSSSAEARAHAEAFKTYFLEYGGESVSWPGLSSGETMITIMDVYEIVLDQGPYVIGVHEASEPELALDVVLGIKRKIAETVP